MTNSSSLRNVLVPFIILFVLSVWVFFNKLGDPHFYDTRKESRRAEIAREMIETGNWIVPHLEGEVILTKPPLLYWAVALSSMNSGITEFTARFPSATAATGATLAIFLLGRYLFSIRVGFLSALILMATNIFAWQARYVEMESMLTFFIVFSLYCFFRGYREPHRAMIWFPLFFVSLGLGTLTKGPFAFTFPLIPIVLYLIIYGDKKFLAKPSFLLSICFFFVVLLPWVLLISLNQPRFLLVALWETIGRVALGYTHREPFYFYFDKMVSTMFPWIFFLPFSIGLVFSERCRQWKKENVFLLFYIFGNLIFLSLSKSKRSFYLAPLAPGVVLLIGSTWDAVWQWCEEKCTCNPIIMRRVLLLSGGALAFITFVAGNPLATNFPGMNFPKADTFLLFLGLTVFIVSLVSYAYTNISKSTIGLITIVSHFFLFQYLYLNYTVPIQNYFDSAKFFYVKVSKIVKTSEPLAYFSDNENYTFTFYARRPITTIKTHEALTGYMSASEKKYAVLSEKHLKFYPKQPWNIKLIGEFSEHRSWGKYFLLCNQ